MPRRSKSYGNNDYWEKRYAKGGSNSTFDWLEDWNDIKYLI